MILLTYLHIHTYIAINSLLFSVQTLHTARGSSLVVGTMFHERGVRNLSSKLEAKMQINYVERYNYYNCGQYPSSCLFFKT
jgi:hypothetical protein